MSCLVCWAVSGEEEVVFSPVFGLRSAGGEVLPRYVSLCGENVTTDSVQKTRQLRVPVLNGKIVHTVRNG